MGETETTDFLNGKVLIAMPGIGDPRFERSVIFICSHSDEGALGLIVNRPAPGIGFGDLLGQLDIEEGSGARQLRIMLGGPVERSRGFVLHSDDYVLAEATLPVADGIGMTASIDILRALASGEGPEHAMLALGYSGWGPGQLEEEIRANGWITGEVDDGLIFGEDDAGKWSAALLRLGVDASMLSRDGGMA
ncbi:YqgE/AlgH family protein [Oceanicella sp. SM1341]|uniref:YqgE/AlgH family protein n=1 Tax=Oceanicella sp. SM1341 TaxID=1548889 RepID=UPI000E47BA86|nr:YqgE/AlgH family protein [Oceanicella sp. SM1341]